MAELNVSGSFLITVGKGAGPEMWVVLSVSTEDGRAKLLKFPKNPNHGSADIFVPFSVHYGAMSIHLRIVQVWDQYPLGFYWLRVEPPRGAAAIGTMGPSTLGVVIDDGTDYGQALVCACVSAKVEAPSANRTNMVPLTRSKRSTGRAKAK